MRIKTKILFTASYVFIFAIISYWIISTSNPELKIFTSTAIADSLSDVSSSAGDVSQLFNERGFYKSNSSSFDENEIINNFNGNLIYEIPLYNFKGEGDLNCDVKLVYNGNVSHRVTVADNTWFNSAGSAIQSKYNINFAEWMISVNGIAIQVMNFNTKLFSHPSGDYNHPISLIPGYHYDDELEVAYDNQKDRINILCGDGSLMTLLNKNATATGDDRYHGYYHCDNKGSYVKAYVYFDTSDHFPDASYRNRFVELLMGDGLIYDFKEYKRKFSNFDTTHCVNYRRPQVLLLNDIRDRFGHRIFINYNFNFSHGFGRPLLQNIGVYRENIDFTFAEVGNGFLINNYTIGNYDIHFRDQVYFDTSGANNRIGIIKQIDNSLGQHDSIDYGSGYQRTLSNLADLHYSDYDLEFSGLSRMVKFVNFLGGKHEYQYFGGTSPMTINASATCGILMSLDTNYYKGVGRDSFFSNMVTYKDDYDKGYVHKCQTQFNYLNYRNRSLYCNSLYDTSDNYFTLKTISPQDTSTTNYSGTTITEYDYKVFSVKVFGIFHPEAVDVTGETKLINEITKDALTGYPYMLTHYEYEKGTADQQIYNGSFLTKSKTNVMYANSGQVSRLWNYIYSYKDNSYDSVVTVKLEVDPNGYKTQTYYANFDTTLNFLAGIPMLGTGGASGSVPDTISYYGPKRFYKIGVDTLIKRYDNSSSRDSMPLTNTGLLQQKWNIYIIDTSNSAGYFGELKAERQYAENNSSAYIETNYTYYKRDTTGRHIYDWLAFPFVEGNLKQTIKQNGEEEKYFYYPISHGENALFVLPDNYFGAPITPSVSYKVKYTDGTESIDSETFFDTRLPIRIDNYYHHSSTYDSLKRVYMNYNSMGKPVMMINENGYLTTLNYDNTYNRISYITLPGDFSKTGGFDSTYVIRRNMDTTVTVSSDAWGNYLLLSDDTSSSNKIHFQNNINNLHDNFAMWYQQDDGGGSFVVSNQYEPFIRLKFDNLTQFNSIDSAILYIVPSSYQYLENGVQNNTGFSFRFQAVTGKGYTYLNYQDSIAKPYLFTQMITAPFDTTLNMINTSCNYDEHKQFIEIKDLLQSLKDSSKGLYGLIIKHHFENLTETFKDLRLKFIDCDEFSATQWLSDYKPILRIHGNFEHRDTIHLHVYTGDTYRYVYDDVNHTTTVMSRLSNALDNFKQVKYYFDGFGNIKRKDNITGLSTFDSVLTRFNFLNKPAINFDGRNDTTRLSYDLLGRQSRTDNPYDNTSSHNTIEYDYKGSLSSYFGSTYSGFIEKQILTDETGRKFNKFFDAVGNLLREEKYVTGDGSGNIEQNDNPFDPDTTHPGLDTPPQAIDLITDYLYDKNYRLAQVKTPETKYIYYYYDSYGRQKARVTPDAGAVNMLYDANSNLIYSQDANQYTTNSGLNTYRSYDALNRLTVIGLRTVTTGSGGIDNFSGDSLNALPDVIGSTDSILIVNVYDSINTAVVSLFSSPPSGYTGANFTRGNLVATAYRTNIGESWNYKYYRYDQRGRVIKMWNYIDGLGWKNLVYYYNSQNQVISTNYDGGLYDMKAFQYQYDVQGRLSFVNLYSGNLQNPPSEEDDDYSSTGWNSIRKYRYNENSQVLKDSNCVSGNYTTYSYNSRNWIYNTSSNDIFHYTLFYNPNGTIRNQDFNGSYSNNFDDNNILWFKHTYDNSNRLVKDSVISSNYQQNSHVMINAYDGDGNLTILKRFDSRANITDTFTYNYYTANGDRDKTNKLKRVTGTTQQYTYDHNGNITTDSINHLFSFKYDYRNLITSFKRWAFTPEGDIGTVGTGEQSYDTYLINYYYDEAGNRLAKKIYKWHVPTPLPIDSEITGDYSGYWTLQSKIIYVRDVSGKELTVYSDTTLQQWNIYGLDNIGKIDNQNHQYYYLKDHLGTVRVVIDSVNNVVFAQDCDSWGYPLQGRTYDATSGSSTNSQLYKFTAKERDAESSLDGVNGYDYFGARYYANRIGRWTSTDPLVEFQALSPYASMLNNPLLNVDVDGRENIVVVGGLDKSGEKDMYKFINSGVSAAMELLSQGTSEQTTIVLLASHMSENEINEASDFIRSTSQSINIVIAKSSEEMVNYLNSKTTDNPTLSNSRSEDQISAMVTFGHGHSDEMDFGYGGDPRNFESQYTLGMPEISNISSGSFKGSNSTIALFNCNTASGNLAQYLSATTKTDVIGFADFVSYSGIYGNFFVRHLTKEGKYSPAIKYPRPNNEGTLKEYINGEELK